MKFVQILAPGGPEVLKISEMEAPSPKTGEVLIQVHAAGVNRPDILQRKGLYPPPPGASPILGLEVSGKIVGLGAGDVLGYKLGDLVCALVSGGGYAEYVVAPASQCLPVPQGISLEEAAGIPETFFTVWTNVFSRGKLASGESILIHGGTSGIGTTAIQLALAFEAKVYTTAGSERKCQFCLDLGAHGAIDYRKKDFVQELMLLTNGRGADVILDMVAGDYFTKNVECLAQEGRLVQIATPQGEKVSLSLGTLMKKCATVTGSTLRPRSVEQKAKIASELRRRVWPLLESGKVKVVIDSYFSLEKASEAHLRMESGEHMGKIILKIIS